MTFYRGEQYILYGYDTERKAEGVDSICPLCGLLIQKSSRVAKIRWGSEPDSDDWTITHPDCAENGKMNIRNVNNEESKTVSQVTTKAKTRKWSTPKRVRQMDYNSTIDSNGGQWVLVRKNDIGTNRRYQMRIIEDV